MFIIQKRKVKKPLTPMERLEIISIWENQTENEPVSKAHLGRLYGITEGSIRKLLKKTNYWKSYAGLVRVRNSLGLKPDQPIPNSIPSHFFNSSLSEQDSILAISSNIDS